MLAKTNPRAGSTGAVERKAWECERCTGSSPKYQQTPLRAELNGSDRCSAVGITAHGHTPVLMLCRLLVAAGHDPARELHAYRGETLCLTIRSIGEAATLDVNSKGTGFVRHRPRHRCNRHRSEGRAAMKAEMVTFARAVPIGNRGVDFNDLVQR
jgi:hypothetical protein